MAQNYQLKKDQVTLTEAEIHAIKTEGLSNVARRLDLPYTTLHRSVKHGYKMTRRNYELIFPPKIELPK